MCLVFVSLTDFFPLHFSSPYYMLGDLLLRCKYTETALPNQCFLCICYLYCVLNLMFLQIKLELTPMLQPNPPVDQHLPSIKCWESE